MNQKRRKMCSGGESVVVEVAMYVCHTQVVLVSCSCAGVMVFCAQHRCELSLIVNPRAYTYPMCILTTHFVHIFKVFELLI